MTAAGLDGHWETTAPLMHSSCMTAWSNLDHSVLMQCLRSSRSVTRLLYTLAVCPTHCSQLDFNPTKLQATIEAKWFWILFLLPKTAICQWRHIYVITTYMSCKYWRDFLRFLVTRNVRIILAKNCEKWPKFVEVTAKILLVLFSGHGVLLRKCQLYVIILK